MKRNLKRNHCSFGVPQIVLLVCVCQMEENQSSQNFKEFNFQDLAFIAGQSKLFLVFAISIVHKMNKTIFERAK